VICSNIPFRFLADSRGTTSWSAPDLAASHAALHPSELAGAPWVRHLMLKQSDAWTFHGPRGEEARVPVVTRAQANTGDGVRALALGGVGFAVLPEYLVLDELRRGALVRVCPGWYAHDVLLFVVLPGGRRRPRRVDVFLEELRQALADAGVARRGV
jgi:DNA-binding transcriptional LysR family regulator